MAIYDKPVKLLFREMIKELAINQGYVITREKVFAWFNERYPKIKKSTLSCHLLRLSVNAPSRIHYNIKSTGDDDLFVQIDSQHFKLYDPLSDIKPIYIEKDAENIVTDEERYPVQDESNNSEFAYEKDLQNFLSRNLHYIDPCLTLYNDEDISGIEFPAGNRFIDILAVDNSNNYVVIELKVSRGFDRVVGQILRYISWIRQNLAEPHQQVRGIIVARKISEDLKLACSEVSHIELYEYELSVSLKKII
ncbi:MAG: endonuclease NucS [Candidatus Auribacterota bacterium]|jgi:hypothetical protein|nr:endonuclease NucS [Candidatus Auribacterota bacterium]